MNVKTHTFCGKKYEIQFDCCDGFCEEPFPTVPSLWVNMEELSDKEQLRVLIHESLHACNWDKSEPIVHQTSKDIARFLWRVGYRKK
jgi:hypothetical protein